MKITGFIYHRLIWPLFLALTLIYSSGKQTPPVRWTLPIPYFDKISHFFIFGLLATLIYRCRKEIPPSLIYGLLAVGLASILGVGDEFYQYTNPYRYAEAKDWMADTLGALVAVVTYRYWGFYRKCLEYEIMASPFSVKTSPSASESL